MQQRQPESQQPNKKKLENENFGIPQMVTNATPDKPQLQV